MNIADTLWGFIRRWYIVLPGLILAVATGLGVFTVVHPGYERTATQLLIPGEGTIPPGTTNPYLFLGGLLQASDIVVRVMQSDEVLGPAVADHPGTEVVIRRDPIVSGPVIQLTVTAKSDAGAEEVLANLVAQTSVVVERLQVQQNVAPDDRMTVSLLTEDTRSIPQQKTRLLLSVGAAAGIVVLTLVVASLVDGLIRRSRRGGRTGRRRAGKRRAGKGPMGDEVEYSVDELAESDEVERGREDDSVGEDDPVREYEPLRADDDARADEAPAGSEAITSDPLAGATSLR
jgi:hypothetical protein